MAGRDTSHAVQRRYPYDHWISNREFLGRCPCSSLQCAGCAGALVTFSFYSPLSSHKKIIEIHPAHPARQSMTGQTLTRQGAISMNLGDSCARALQLDRSSNYKILVGQPGEFTSWAKSFNVENFALHPARPRTSGIEL